MLQTVEKAFLSLRIVCILNENLVYFWSTNIIENVNHYCLKE
jgi:hypothetical protein